MLAMPRLDGVSKKTEAREKVFWVKRKEVAFPAYFADRAPWRHSQSLWRFNLIIYGSLDGARGSRANVAGGLGNA